MSNDEQWQIMLRPPWMHVLVCGRSFHYPDRINQRCFNAYPIASTSERLDANSYRRPCETGHSTETSMKCPAILKTRQLLLALAVSQPAQVCRWLPDWDWSHHLLLDFISVINGWHGGVLWLVLLLSTPASSVSTYCNTSIPVCSLPPDGGSSGILQAKTT